MFEELRAELEDKLNEKVVETEVMKGLIKVPAFMIGDEDIQVVVYPEKLIHKPVDDVVASIKNGLRGRAEMAEHAKQAANFENIKDKLLLCIGPKSDDERTVVRDFLDMSLYVRINLSLGTIKVTKELLEHWDVSEDELFELATQDTQYECESIAKVLGFPEEETNLYVITTHDKAFGASAITNKDMLESFRNKFNTDVLIFPSSIHEILVAPVNYMDESFEELRRIVTTINNSVLSPEDILSNNVYIYDGECRIMS